MGRGLRGEGRELTVQRSSNQVSWTNWALWHSMALKRVWPADFRIAGLRSRTRVERWQKTVTHNGSICPASSGVERSRWNRKSVRWSCNVQPRTQRKKHISQKWESIVGSLHFHICLANLLKGKHAAVLWIMKCSWIEKPNGECGLAWKRERWYNWK